MAERKDRAGAITVPPLIYMAFLIAGIYWRELVPLSLGGRPLRYSAGGIIFTAGLGLLIWALRTMTRAKTTFNPWLPSSRIVSWGPFRFTRNPIYVGDALLYLGTAIAFDSALAILLLPLVLNIVYFGVIRREERYLEAKFGEEYVAYKNQVRRWL